MSERQGEEGLPSEVILEAAVNPIPRRCAVDLDSVERVSISALAERLGRPGDERMRQVCAALAAAVDCGQQLRLPGVGHQP